jgi:hypothetical protein
MTDNGGIHLMLRTFKAVAFAMLILFAADASGGRAADAGAPATPIDIMSDVYHDVTVADPYRWLENGADPKVHDWSVVQDNRARAYLNALALRQYALTAYILSLNKLIGENDAMDAKTLPQVKMPNRDNWIMPYPDRI